MEVLRNWVLTSSNGKVSKCLCTYFEREREREREKASTGEGPRESRERESQAGPTLSAESHVPAQILEP